MNKWDEIYGPATPLADLESRIEALERSIGQLREITEGYKIALKNVLEVLNILNESRRIEPWKS